MPELIDFTSVYSLAVAEDKSCYEITNNVTEVVEARVEQLPEAYHVMYHLTMAMQKRPWEWVLEEDDSEDDDICLN